MKPITICKADDGSTFNDKNKCALYENLCSTIKAIMFPLGELEVGKIHDIPTLLSARNSFLEVANTHLGLSYSDHFIAQIKNENNNQGFVGRIIGDSDIRVLNSTWYRFMSTSMISGKEYDQPYYVIQELVNAQTQI